VGEPVRAAVELAPAIPVALLLVEPGCRVPSALLPLALVWNNCQGTATRRPVRPAVALLEMPGLALAPRSEVAVEGEVPGVVVALRGVVVEPGVSVVVEGVLVLSVELAPGVVPNVPVLDPLIPESESNASSIRPD